MTTYRNENGQWKSKNTYIGAVGFIDQANNSGSITCNNSASQNLKSKILAESNSLNFISNGVLWYKGKGNGGAILSTTNDVVSSKKEVLSEVFKDSKSGSWIWVEDNRSSKSGLITNNFSWLTNPKGKETAWKLKGCKQVYFGDSTELKLKDSEKIRDSFDEIEKLETKGKWVDTGKICAPYYLRNISNEQLQDLKLFCSAKQKSEEV